MAVKLCLKVSLLMLSAVFFTVAGASEERIEAREVLDPQIFAASRWQAQYPHLLTATNGSAEQGVVLRFNLDHGGINSERFPYIYGENPTLNTITLPLELPKEKFSRYNQLSFMVYPDVPDRAAVWVEMGGSGIWTQACYPLIPRQWNRVSVCWSNHLTAEAAEKLSRLIIARQIYGRLPGDPEWCNYYVKDFVLEKVVTGSESVWAASPEKIIVPQNGFAPGYTKHAILPGDWPTEDFSVVDATGKAVFTGRVQSVEYPTGRFKIADFSVLRTPGRYRIKSGSVFSAAFEISGNHQQILVDKCLNFFLSMRSGMATPAHPACFLEPHLRSDNRQAVDLSGGWFDASDLRCYHSMAMKTILRPLALSYDFNVPELYSEMRWGALLLTKLFDPQSGFPYTVQALYPQNDPDKRLASVFRDGNYRKVNNFWTDNRPDTGDERTIHVAQGKFSCHPDLIDSHWGLTAAGFHFFLAAGAEDRQLAQKIFDQCKRHFDFLCDHTPAELYRNGIGGFNRESNTAIALQLENAMAVFRATGKTYYREVALEMAQKLLDRQRRQLYGNSSGYLGGFFSATDAKNSASLERDDFGIYALSRLADLLPGTRIAFDIHASLRIYAQFFLKNPATRILPYSAPYAHFSETPKADWFCAEVAVTPDGRKLYGYLDSYFMSGINGTAAMQTQILAHWLNDPALQEIAAGYLTFHTGENPAGRSYIAGVGENYRRDIMSSALGWIPGMMSNPLVSGGIPGMPYNRHHGTNEIYTQTQAAYTVAAAIINAPAKINWQLRNAPEKLHLTVTDTVTGRSVFDGDVAGETDLTLPGLSRYRFEFSNGLTFEENILNGEKRRGILDMSSFLQIGLAEVPEKVVCGSEFTMKVKLTYFGDQPLNTVLMLRGDNLTLTQNSLPLSIKPGESTVIVLQGRTMRSNEPFVVMVCRADEPGKIYSAAGVSE